MFERYTEIARRIIFFARYEASVLASPYIECDHLLLGMLREPTPLRRQLSEQQREKIRAAISARAPRDTPGPTSVDLPLSNEAKDALIYAAEESERLHDEFIEPGHLLLGLLRVENSPAAALLREYSIDGLSEDDEGTLPASDAAEPLLLFQADRLRSLIRKMRSHVDRSEEAAGVRLKRRPWTRKEALGHLIDWAAAHQQLFARALTEPNVTMPLFAPDSWVEAQGYASLPWGRLFRLWAELNGLILHVLPRIPAGKLETPCRIGIAEPAPLSGVIEAYIDHCEDIAAQILLHPGK